MVVALASTACGSGRSPNDPGTAEPTTSIGIGPTTVAVGDAEACALMSETVGAAGLVPKDSPSWRDERERILIDARREAELLRRVAATVPADLVVAFETVASYADFVADAMDASSGYEDARRRLDAFGDLDEVRARDGDIASWRTSNC